MQAAHLLFTKTFKIKIEEFIFFLFMQWLLVK